MADEATKPAVDGTQTAAGDPLGAGATSPAPRAPRLAYAGDGTRWFQGIPARDLTEAETAALSDARYAEVTGPQADGSPPLYVAAPPATDAPPADPPRGRKAAQPPAAGAREE